jgi:hypothetical protein
MKEKEGGVELGFRGGFDGGFVACRWVADRPIAIDGSYLLAPKQAE